MPTLNSVKVRAFLWEGPCGEDGGTGSQVEHNVVTAQLPRATLRLYKELPRLNTENILAVHVENVQKTQRDTKIKRQKETLD